MQCYLTLPSTMSSRYLCIKSRYHSKFADIATINNIHIIQAEVATVRNNYYKIDNDYHHREKDYVAF